MNISKACKFLKLNIRSSLLFIVFGPLFCSFIYGLSLKLAFGIRYIHFIDLILTPFSMIVVGVLTGIAYKLSIIPLIISSFFYIVSNTMTNTRGKNKLLIYLVISLFSTNLYFYYDTSRHSLDLDFFLCEISGTIGIFILMIFIDKWQRDYIFDINRKDNINYIFLTISTWFTLIINIFSNGIPHFVMGFIAKNIAHNCGNYDSISCDLFDWDEKLKVAYYFSYTLLFILCLLMLILIIKTKKGLACKVNSYIAFIVLFPTYINSWNIDMGESTKVIEGNFIVPQIIVFDINSVLSFIISISTVIFINKKLGK